MEIIIIILFIIIFYLIYRDICRQNNLNKTVDKFSTQNSVPSSTSTSGTPSSTSTSGTRSYTQLKKNISESIKNLGLIAKKLLKNRKLHTLPTNVRVKNLILPNGGNITVSKGLNIDGKTSINGNFDVQGHKGQRTCFSVRYNKNNKRMETRVDNWLHIGAMEKDGTQKGTLFIEDVLIAAKDKHNRAAIDFSTNDQFTNIEKSITGNDSYVSASYLISNILEARGSLQAGYPKKGDVNFFNSNLNNVKQINVDFITNDPRKRLDLNIIDLPKTNNPLPGTSIINSVGNIFNQIISPDHNTNIFISSAPRGSIMVLNYNYVDSTTGKRWGKDSWIDLLYTQSEAGGCDQYLERKSLSYNETKLYKDLIKNGLKLRLLDEC